MARLTGANLKVFWVDNQGTIEFATVRSFNPNSGYDTAETSAAGDEMRNHQLTLQTFEPSVEYVDFDGTVLGVYGTLNAVPGTALRIRTAPGSRGTLLWGEQGTAAGKPKGGMDVYIDKNEASIVYDDAIVKEATFKAASGQWVANPGDAVWP